jgi:uncharacterized protein
MSREADPAPLPFAPAAGLGHQHLQTMLSSWSVRGRWIRSRASALLGSSTEELIDCGDGIRLLGHFSRQPSAGRGVAVLFHGWEGCADANYVLSTAAALFAAGFEVFRLNFRDHGGTHELNEELFHSCRIDEVVAALRVIQQRHPGSLRLLIGFSLGGNFALRAAARARSAGLDLDRVYAVCPVLSPHSTMRALEEGLWIYRHYYLQRWRRSLLAKAASFPRVYDFGDLRRFRTLTATTAFFVERYTQFADLDEYLNGYALTGAALADLDVPSRLIASADDPIIPSRDLADIACPPQLEIELVESGGHCGFLGDWRLTSWIDRHIVADLARLDRRPGAKSAAGQAPSLGVSPRTSAAARRRRP